MTVQVERQGDIAIVIPAETLNGGVETKELEDRLCELIQEQAKVLLNLGKTTRMNSIVLGVLMSVYKSALDHGVTFCICEAPQWMRGSHPFSVPLPFNFFDSCDEALKSLKAS